MTVNNGYNFSPRKRENAARCANGSRRDGGAPAVRRRPPAAKSASARREYRRKRAKNAQTTSRLVRATGGSNSGDESGDRSDDFYSFTERGRTARVSADGA
ncbi:hypothetical protein EVAR_65170_1 [Eumeta japonica]|uniref:Uncharacterized protein n=1 Tax=Eumeta variegata TaxID=151549 RepID=A0A4C1ZKV1_EUMVA|nr:hypothetical protein EVAR_65170_1 [Eumeta japonica]